MPPRFHQTAERAIRDQSRVNDPNRLSSRSDVIGRVTKRSGCLVPDGRGVAPAVIWDNAGGYPDRVPLVLIAESLTFQTHWITMASSAHFRWPIAAPYGFCSLPCSSLEVERWLASCARSVFSTVIWLKHSGVETMPRTTKDQQHPRQQEENNSLSPLKRENHKTWQ